MDDEGLADVEAANPFVYSDFTQELVLAAAFSDCSRSATDFLFPRRWRLQSRRRHRPHPAVLRSKGQAIVGRRLSV